MEWGARPRWTGREWLVALKGRIILLGPVSEEETARLAEENDLAFREVQVRLGAEERERRAAGVREVIAELAVLDFLDGHGVPLPQHA